MMCMGQYWEKTTGMDLLKHPEALEAASIFVSYIYTADDFIDSPPASENFVDADTIEREMRMGNYSGKDMNFHFVNAVARGIKKLPISSEEFKIRAEKLLNRVESYTRKSFSYYQDNFDGEKNSKVSSVEEAFKYRDDQSAEMGAVIADILSTICGVDEYKAEKARKNLRTVTMIGQLQDEWWDLPMEIDNGRNIFALVLGRYPEELHSVKQLPQITDCSLIPFELLKKIAPNTIKDYFTIYQGIAHQAADRFVERDMINMWNHLMPITRNVPQKWVNYGITNMKT